MELFVQQAIRTRFYYTPVNLFAFYKSNKFSSTRRCGKHNWMEIIFKYAHGTNSKQGMSKRMGKSCCLTDQRNFTTKIFLTQQNR